MVLERDSVGWITPKQGQLPEAEEMDLCFGFSVSTDMVKKNHSKNSNLEKKKSWVLVKFNEVLSKGKKQAFAVIKVV